MYNTFFNKCMQNADIHRRTCADYLQKITRDSLKISLYFRTALNTQANMFILFIAEIVG